MESFIFKRKGNLTNMTAMEKGRFFYMNDMKK